MGLALTLFVLLVVLALVFPHPQPSGLDLAITIFAAFGVFLSFIEFSFVFKLSRWISAAKKEKATLISERGLYLMPATTYSPTHFRVQYHRPGGA